MKTAYIVGGYRSAVGKSGKGVFRFTRPDEMGKQVVQHLLKDFPELDTNRIDDIIVGNATPEAEQGLNLARMISLMGLNTDKVPGMTINRYCSSGLQSIALAKYQIESGAAHCIIAGGVECMSPIPFGGWRIIPNYDVSKDNSDWYWNMGLTAEAVADKWNISREDQDTFAIESYKRSANAWKEGKFDNEVVPINVHGEQFVTKDEGPRKPDEDKIKSLNPSFLENGTITPATSSPISIGSSAVLITSKKFANSNNLHIRATIKGRSIAGVDWRKMGMGPIPATNKVLKKTKLNIQDIDIIELNEAFAAQALYVIENAQWDQSKINLNGGSIALGHPLGCSGARILTTLLNVMEQQDVKTGLATMCIGSGQGIATILER